MQDVINATSDEERDFFRKVRNTERMTSMGFPASAVLDLTPAKALKASGNAYPVPLIIATLHPMLEAIGRSGIAMSSWPPSEMISKTVPACVGAVMSALKRPGQKIKKSKAKAKAKAKSRKRTRGSDSD